MTLFYQSNPTNPPSDTPSNPTGLVAKPISPPPISASSTQQAQRPFNIYQLAKQQQILSQTENANLFEDQTPIVPDTNTHHMAPRAWFQRFANIKHAPRAWFQHNKTDKSLFAFSRGSDIAYLLLYVLDMILTASSAALLQRIIALLHSEFVMTFLSIISLNSNPCRTPVNNESKLGPYGDPVSDPTLYRSLLHVSSIAQLIAYTDIGLVGCHVTRWSTSGYCVFLGDNLLSYSVKRHVTLSRSSVEGENYGVANVLYFEKNPSSLHALFHHPRFLDKPLTWVFADTLMGPIRGSKSFKKSAPLSEPQPSDWWPHFAQSLDLGVAACIYTRKSNPPGLSPLVVVNRACSSTALTSDKETWGQDLNLFCVLSFHRFQAITMLESMFKMSIKTFGYICSLVKEEMMVKCANFTDIDGNLFSPYDMVAIALRRLGSGESQQNVGNSLNVKKMTVARLTRRFVDALNVQGLHHLSWPSTEVEMEDLKCQFEKIWGIPNCCGAIDTTHILMSVVSTDPSKKMWYDREKNETMTLQAIVGPDLRFRNITAGSPGCLTDERILKSSAFVTVCNKGERLNGKQKVLSEGNKIEEYIVGNSGFPLLKWLLTPYQGRDFVILKLSLMKMFVENNTKWQMKLSLKLKAELKIIKGEDEVQDRLVFSNCHDLAYRPLFCDSDNDQNGSLLRDKIAVHLSTP
ncbi:harbinger transposase-derived nuclease [Tanacetum coccineum]